MFGNRNDNQIGIRYYINFNIDGSSYSVFDRNRKFYGYVFINGMMEKFFKGKWVNDQHHGYEIFKYNDRRVSRNVEIKYKKMVLEKN